jgi:hypothetical protein
MKLKISIAALALVATSAFANHAALNASKEVVQLKDGGTLYVFHNGKMAKEDRYGRAQYLKANEVLETADGRRITATSNEVALLQSLLLEGHSNN